MNGFDLALLTTDPAPYVIMFTEQTIWQVLGHIITVLVLFFCPSETPFQTCKKYS